MINPILIHLLIKTIFINNKYKIVKTFFLIFHYPRFSLHTKIQIENFRNQKFLYLNWYWQTRNQYQKFRNRYSVPVETKIKIQHHQGSYSGQYTDYTPSRCTALHLGCETLIPPQESIRSAGYATAHRNRDKRSAKQSKAFARYS